MPIHFYHFLFLFMFLFFVLRVSNCGDFPLLPVLKTQQKISENIVKYMEIYSEVPLLDDFTFTPALMTENLGFSPTLSASACDHQDKPGQGGRISPVETKTAVKT